MLNKDMLHTFGMTGLLAFSHYSESLGFGRAEGFSSQNLFFFFHFHCLYFLIMKLAAMCMLSSTDSFNFFQTKPHTELLMRSKLLVTKGLCKKQCVNRDHIHFQFPPISKDFLAKFPLVSCVVKIITVRPLLLMQFSFNIFCRMVKFRHQNSVKCWGNHSLG